MAMGMVKNQFLFSDKLSQRFEQGYKWNPTEDTIGSGSSDRATDDEHEEHIPYIKRSDWFAMNSGDSDTEEEQMLEVEDASEKILKEICGHDKTENENQDDCVTMMVTVFKQDEEMVKSLIVGIAGAVAGVRNRFERIEQNILSITTLWIYNKELRQSIEAEWKTKKDMTVTLPHKAFTSSDLKESLSMNSADKFISFTLDNMRVKCFSPDKSHTKAWSWIVELMPGDAASGGSPTLGSSSAKHTEPMKDDPELRKEVDEKIEKFKKASSYSGVTDIDTSSDKLESSKIIATISLSREDMADKGALKSLVILSIGEQSKFIYPTYPDETLEAGNFYDKMVVTEDVTTRKNILGPFRYWGMYTCEMEGEGVQALEEKIRESWDKNIAKSSPLNVMACHALFVEGETQFEEIINSCDETVVYDALEKKVVEDRLYHITVWSHLPRKKALHDQLVASNRNYKKKWGMVEKGKLSVDKFYTTFIQQSLWEAQGKAVSFRYLSFQFPSKSAMTYNPLFSQELLVFI